MSMANRAAIDVETLSIDSGCSLEKKFTKFIYTNPWIIIIPKYQSSWLMSKLCMWSFDLRHWKNHFMWFLNTQTHVKKITKLTNLNIKSLIKEYIGK